MKNLADFMMSPMSSEAPKNNLLPIFAFISTSFLFDSNSIFLLLFNCKKDPDFNLTVFSLLVPNNKS